MLLRAAICAEQRGGDTGIAFDLDRLLAATAITHACPAQR
jgi:hypothetical protein